MDFDKIETQFVDVYYPKLTSKLKDIDFMLLEIRKIQASTFHGNLITSNVLAEVPSDHEITQKTREACQKVTFVFSNFFPISFFLHPH